MSAEMHAKMDAKMSGMMEKMQAHQADMNAQLTALELEVLSATPERRRSPPWPTASIPTSLRWPRCTRDASGSREFPSPRPGLLWPQGLR